MASNTPCFNDMPDLGSKDPEKLHFVQDTIADICGMSARAVNFDRREQPNVSTSSFPAFRTILYQFHMNTTALCLAPRLNLLRLAKVATKLRHSDVYLIEIHMTSRSSPWQPTFSTSPADLGGDHTPTLVFQSASDGSSADLQDGGHT